jgi:thiol-disulfide isomerase/thioredoxin
MVSKNTRLVSLFGTVSLFAVLVSGSSAQVVAGSTFPSLSGSALAGDALPPPAGKVVVVDFWASWCAPCKASFPAYSRLQNQFGGQGLVIVGVSVDDNASAYAAFVSKYKPAFFTVRDAQQKLVSAVQVPTMPTSYIIDRNGKVRYVHAGFHGAQTEHELIAEIELLLGEKATAP